MLAAIGGYYNGSQIVLDEQVELARGQRLIITILEQPKPAVTAAGSLRRYMGRGEKLFDGDAAEYVKELRDDDRL